MGGENFYYVSGFSEVFVLNAVLNEKNLFFTFLFMLHIVSDRNPTDCVCLFWIDQLCWICLEVLMLCVNMSVSVCVRESYGIFTVFYI